MTPRELALRILAQRFGTASASAGSPELAAFQQEAHDRLLAAIGGYGGALLADSVGLGKTFVAAAVARSLARPGEPAIAVVPTALVRLWRGALRGLPTLDVTTHATLSRGGGGVVAPGGLVIVDEAHAFRNPHTRRYAALARLAAGRAVLLLTATPVNNSVWDLYWLLRLFAADDAFLDIGVPHLAACFDRAHRSGHADRIPAVLAAIAVRRNRRIIRELHGQVTVGSRVLSFPRRAPPRPVPYDLPRSVRELLSGTIEALELTPWQDGQAPAAAWLLRLLLLKRLESSRAALHASLGRICGATREYVRALDAGLLLVPARSGTRARDPAQLQLVSLLHRPLPPQLDRAALRASAERDIARLADCLSRLGAEPESDPKLAALHALLAGELRDRSVLLFTEFRDTAEYLWRALRGRVPCALIHGSGAWLGSRPSSRRAIIERFAPVANGAKPPPGRERVLLLIATDVLSEGLNLQDAADVVSYDLPWNPVRLVQRLGRIDRLGSPHARVRSWYFVPHRHLEDLLGLLRRIRRKLRAIRITLGPDEPVLALPAGSRSLRRLAQGDTRPARAADRLRESMFDVEERLRTAFRRAARPAEDPLAGLPLEVTGSPRPTLRTRPAGGTARSGGHAEVARAALAPGLVATRPAREPPDALVVVRVGNAQRAVFVAGRSCWEDDVAAGEILLHALRGGSHDSGDPPGAADARGAVTLQRRALAWLRQPPPPVRPTPSGQGTRLRLLRLLQEVPGGPADLDCSRAERLLHLLVDAPPGTSKLTSGLPALDPAASLQAMLHRLEQQVRDANPHRTVPDRLPPTAPGARVLGVFLLDVVAG